MTRGKLRMAAEALADGMAMAGLEPDIWHSTPVEICRRMDAFQSRLALAEDMLWLVRRHAAAEACMPRRYACRTGSGGAMNDAEMKRALCSIYERSAQNNGRT